MAPSFNALLEEERNTIKEGGNPLEIILCEDIVPTETKPEYQDTQNQENKVQKKKILLEATIKGNWVEAEDILYEDKLLATSTISDDGSTMLHIAVGLGYNSFAKRLLWYINEEQVLQKRNSDGSTALHIAAIVGNKHAAELLIRKNSKLLQIEDDKGEHPMHKAYENMHLDTIEYLLKAMKDDGNKTVLQSFLAGSVHPGVEVGVDLLVNAISGKQYGLAKRLLRQFPHLASKNEDVLMALAKTFPSGLEYAETLIYPIPGNTIMQTPMFVASVGESLVGLPALSLSSFPRLREYDLLVGFQLFSMILIVIALVPCVLLGAIVCIISMILFAGCLLFNNLYALLWESILIRVEPFKHIENKTNQWEVANDVLELVCDEIDKLEYDGSHHPFYSRPLLEASCQNAYKVVEEILCRSPEAIQSRDKDGYDIIQLAIIHRSEEVYDLIHCIGERKNLYRTILDSSKNNIFYLAGRLAPSSVLSQRTGAALQLQRELQWREEVKKLVFPTYLTQQNEYKETPDMVFTREHENLVKEGEQWMKTTAESCSITAALITTIIFAAAITVPGGSNQEKGTPLFKNEIAFTIFAISDAISLFASSTSLLVFLSILTTRFAEKDFLVSLPKRLFIGLFSLLLSTTAMMVAFSATLFLVFCEQKPWMLAPICGLAFIPISSFVTLQFPLMLDLYRSTYLHIFGKNRASVMSRFYLNDTP